MRGRKPVPEAINAVRGNPGKGNRRRRNQLAPAGKAGKPADLTPEAATEWVRLAPALHRLGILTPADRAFFVCNCEAVASFRRANAKLLEQGELVLDADGLPMRNPWVKIRADAAVDIHRLGSEFGLSPSIRARFVIREPDKLAGDNPAAKYFAP
jgi:P27 family predicted phage terminase small subunit